ncbi:MAG: glycosyltransferase [Flavobacteriales bacterium]
MEKKINVLYISQKPCIPVVDGGTYAIHSFLSAVSNVKDLNVTYLPISTPKHPHDALGFASAFKTIPQVVLALDPNRLTPHLLSIFSPIPMNVRRYQQRSTRQKLETLASNHSYDWIICDGLYALSVIPNEWFECKKILYRSHNLEFEHWAQRASFSSGIFGWFYHKISQKLKPYETALLKKCSAIFCLSTYDYSCIKSNINPSTHLFYPTFALQPSNIAPTAYTLYFVGDCTWPPNRDGITVFIDSVWPKIKEILPQVTLHLAGKGTARFTNKKAGIEGYGFIQDLKSFVADKQAMISPLRMATGINIKILENMAMGKPCIATPESAKGFPEKAGLLSIHPLPEAFASACLEQITHVEANRVTTKKAEEFIQEHCNETTQILQLEAFFHES